MHNERAHNLWECMKWKVQFEWKDIDDHLIIEIIYMLQVSYFHSG